MRCLYHYMILFVSCYLCACSLFSVTSPEQRIMLFPEVFPKPDAPPITASIAFTNTTTNPFLNTNVIIIRNGNTLSRLKGAVWTDSIASLINYTILSTLRSSSLFSSISTDADGIIALYTIQTSLAQWNIEVKDGKYFVVGELYANILSKKKGEIFSQRRWIVDKEIPNLTITTVSNAFQSIAQEIIPEFIRWAETTIESIDRESIESV